MSKIIYELIFHSSWQCGSGLAAGVESDSIAIKDKNVLPYVPGKTIKGLVREAFALAGGSPDSVKKLFGTEYDTEGCLFFSNASFSREDAERIVAENLTGRLFNTVSNIRIMDSITVKGSLRSVEVCVPCSLYGAIHINCSIDEIEHECLQKAVKLIKRMGTGRNRGYGRCSINFIEED